MFKTEATLGLIASILGIIAVVLLLIIGLLVGIVFNAANTYMDEFDAAMEEYADADDMMDYNSAKTAVGAGIAVIVIGIILMISSVVVGFIGTSKLRTDNKKGGILLIVAGGLSLISLFLGGFWGIASVVLFLIGGIMAVAKKETPAVPAA